jgi:hypothetical protein
MMFNQHTIKMFTFQYMWTVIWTSDVTKLCSSYDFPISVLVKSTLSNNRYMIFTQNTTKLFTFQYLWTLIWTSDVTILYSTYDFRILGLVKSTLFYNHYMMFTKNTKKCLLFSKNVYIIFRKFKYQYLSSKCRSEQIPEIYRLNINFLFYFFHSYFYVPFFCIHKSEKCISH